MSELLAIQLEGGGLLIVLGIIFGFYMAWSIGANDVANAMGTSVGAGTLTLRQAVLVAAIMEFCGSVFVGSHVSETVRSGIFDPTMLTPLTVGLGFLSALLAAAVWLQIATYFGWPVSTTHSIVGSLVGVGVLAGGLNCIEWRNVLKITLSWILSPILGAALAYAMFRFLQRHVFDRKRPLEQCFRLAPYLTGYVAFVLTLAALWKGLKNLHLDFSLPEALLIAAVISVATGLLSIVWVRTMRRRIERERAERGIDLVDETPGGIPFVPKEYRNAPEPKVVLRPPLASGSELPSKKWEFRRQFEFEKVEQMLGKLMLVSACFLAFAHGANDVANAVGPLAGVVTIARSGVVETKAMVPLWCLILGGSGIVLGLATWGYRVIETVGRKITHLTPSRGFIANTAAATVIVAASRLGLPISTTHTLVGTLLGIGLARGIEYLNLRIVREIVISWIVTVPAGAGFAMIFSYLLRLIFHNSV